MADTESPKTVYPPPPPKEVFRSLDPEEVTKHAHAARMLMPLSGPPETEFLRAYACGLEAVKCDIKVGENPKAIKRGLEAAAERLPITTALRDLQKFLAASFRGSFKSEKKTLALRKNASRPRHKISDPRQIRQPLTVSEVEMELVRQAVKKMDAEMAEFVRENVLAVCSGVVPFVAPPVVQTGGRNKQYQVRWSDKEWEAVTTKANECYGESTGRRGHTGILIRDVVLAKAREVLGV